MNDLDEKKQENASCGCGGDRSCRGPKKWIWALLVLAVIGVLIAKNADKKSTLDGTAVKEPLAAAEASQVATRVSEAVAQGQSLPRLVDLGAGKCMSCKMMTPILEDLKQTYAGKMDVQFIDVWENTDAAQKYGINVIPTQIFFDAEGKELFRHEGFFGKEAILSKWQELGVELAK